MTHLTVEKDEIICHCSCTTRQQIIKLIHNGSNTLEKISSMTGAIAGCGACETWIDELLAETLQANTQN